MTEVVWLNRSLFDGPNLTLVTSQEQFAAALVSLGLVDDCSFCLPTADATTHSYTGTQGGVSCIVALAPSVLKRKNKILAYGILVHEATHVWQHLRSVITYSTDPQRTGGLEAELEAYAVQNISIALMEAYEAQRKRK